MNVMLRMCSAAQHCSLLRRGNIFRWRPFSTGLNFSGDSPIFESGV